MENSGLIKLPDALKLVGVSAQTLERFVETGYLNCETHQNTPCYHLSELQALFGIDAELEDQPEVSDTSVATDSDKSLYVELEEEQLNVPLSEATDDRELHRLTVLNEMYEKLLDRREQEIKDLYDQRAWLRERIEKLEEKAERDQLLLISETQLITKLVKQRQNESPVRKALTWLGVINDNEPRNSATIEFTRKAQNTKKAQNDD